jgi:hypothetical protein
MANTVLVNNRKRIMSNEALTSAIESSTVALALAAIDHEMLVHHARGEDTSPARAASGVVFALINALSTHGYSIEDSLKMLKNISKVPPSDLGA